MTNFPAAESKQLLRNPGHFEAIADIRDPDTQPLNPQTHRPIPGRDSRDPARSCRSSTPAAGHHPQSADD